MTAIVILALSLSLVIYLFVGIKLSRKTLNLGDLIPLTFGQAAKVSNSNEFSASTVATTVSLSTVIVAFFELVPSMGVWLGWTVVTTALGLMLMGLISTRIWERMAKYDHRPSLHEFLGVEYDADSVALVGAIFTSIGYLTAFAVELTVGSRFLAGLVPEIPEWLTVIVISVVAFTYTTFGGFRAVIVTDRLQMFAIWFLLFSLLAFYNYYAFINGGWAVNFTKIPENIFSLSWSPALISFVAGIFVMNVFLFISNMGLWQRIAASEEPKTVVNGLWKSVFSSALSWGLFVFLACFAFIMVFPKQGENLLITLIAFIGTTGVVGKVVVFAVVLGLYGAMLSTASTQLIAVAHTVYEDIIAKYRNISLTERLKSKKELKMSRFILIGSAFFAVILVEILRIGGFSVADLAFAIYGASLCLVPPILMALFGNRYMLKQLRNWANFSIVLGFVSGWGSAIMGKITGDGNLVFLAPCISMGVSSVVMAIGCITAKVSIK